MYRKSLFLVFALTASTRSEHVLSSPSTNSPCSKIGGQEWLVPQDARACMLEMPFDKKIQNNVLDVVTKTLAFHASTNYQLQAPKPYDKDVHWDLLKGLEEIRSKIYASDFDFHREVQQSLKRVNDGHLMYANWCYDGVYITYNPFPLVLLTNTTDHTQNIHISPVAHQIASTVFGSKVKFWEDVLGQPLENYSGSRVIRINGEEPFQAVDVNANITGRFQGLSSRQNAFFSSTARGADGWHYILGEFAELVQPIVDSVTLTIQRVGSTIEETVTIPYLSKFNRKEHFNDQSDYQKKFCSPTKETNGHHLYRLRLNDTQQDEHRTSSAFHTSTIKPTEIILPQDVSPDLPSLPGSNKDIQFYILDDKTGVLVIGSFEGETRQDLIKCSLLRGLQEMRAVGVGNLIIDVTNNSGGFVCVAQFLHRLLFGQTDETYPQPGLDTTIRVTPMAQRIVKNMFQNDPNGLIVYNREWHNATNYPIDVGEEHWFSPVNVTINDRQDAFTQKLGKECEVWSVSCEGKRQKLGTGPLFKAKDIVLLSNGRCGSSCAVFSTLLAKKHGVRTIVAGGKSDVPQQYCGFVGGESVSFVDLDTALITTGIKKKAPYPPDVPPPLELNAAMTVTWRLAYGVDDPSQPEEWQDHTAAMTFPLTFETVNKPQAIWEAISQTVFFPTPPALQVQF